MKTQVLITSDYSDWFSSLSHHHKKAVRRVVAMLEAAGVTLPFPYSTGIKGSQHPLRELRIKAKGDQIRVFYAFDPDRDALLLIGGNKTGDDRFYDKFIPVAEAIWERYLSQRENL